MAITLYGIPGTATTAVHMVLEEVGAPYAFVTVERDEHGVPTAPEGYLRLSPFGKVPALEHDGFALTESAAICHHLADAFPDAGLLPPVGSHERSEALRWLMFLTNTVQPAYLRFFYPERHTTDPAGVPAVVEAAVRELAALRDHVADRLGAGPFALGERFTVVDPYLAMLSSWGTELPEGSRWWEQPAIARHYDAVLARPGCHRAVADEGGTLATGA